MRPAYELLRLPCAGDAELRRSARAHPESSRAAHVSRSYRAPLALIAWHDAPVGVDIERIEPCGPTFARSICTPAEIALYADRFGDSSFVTSLWASKEALAKALGDPLAYDPRRLDSPIGWSGGAAGWWRAEEINAPAGHVAWLVWALEEAGERGQCTLDSPRGGTALEQQTRA